MTRFKYFLFGSPRLERDGVVIKISRRKALALLSYLAATGKSHARDSLAALFWPDHSQSKARVALSRHLSYLNKILGAEALALETESVALRDNFWLDVAEFAAVLAAHPTVTAHDLPTVQAAIDLYQADFLAGFSLPDCPDFDDWQAFQSESLRQILRAALEKMALTQAALHDNENAIATARRWLALDPLDEAAHRTLMQLYAQSGQQAAALRQYEQCRQVLADELDAPPAAETTELAERIRAGDYRRETWEQASRGDVDISPPLPLTPVSKHPLVGHNLPAQTIPFIGRERELAELTHRLTNPDTRLVTILGPGGMGKTRLARQVGRRLLGQFADGIWFLSLAAVDADTFGPAFNPLLNGLAGLFGLRLHGGSSPQEQVLAYLQDRQMLLIIDNLEHLIADSEVISQLISNATRITVLTTSRERLNLQEEWLFPLEGLALTSPGEGAVAPSLGGIKGGLSEAVQLFKQTARRMQPEFDLSPNLPKIAQICHLVEGMPLGIELAASWVRYMSPAEIAQEIEKDIDFLASRVRNLPARHRSLRAVFDHSWQLLSPQEQAVLSQLVVFRGGFRSAEAQAVMGASRLMLTGLVDKTLVSVSAEGRYDLHERLRQYLLEKLREDLPVYQAAHDRHSHVYLALLQLDPAELSKQTTLQRLMEDFDNIRAAWHWAIDHAHWSTIRCARRGVHTFCLHKGWFLEENELNERTISCLKHRLAQPGVPPEAEVETEIPILLAAMHCQHIETQGRLGIHDPTRQTMLDKNLNILRALGPTAYPELVDGLIGAAFPQLRRLVDGHETNRRYSQEALTLCQSIGDQFGQRVALRGLGFAAVFAGQFERAASYADQILALAESYTYTGLSMRGHIAIARGDYPLAEEYKRQCYHLAVSIDPYFPAMPFFLADLANIARLQGDYAQATAYLQQAATIEHTLGQGHPAGLRHFRHHEVLLVSGYLAETQGDLLAAREAFAEIWQQDQGQSHYSPAALIGLGWVALQSEDWSDARHHFATALPLIIKLQTAPQALDALAGVAHLQAHLDQPVQALTLIGLVHHHPGSYRECKDRLAGLEADLRSALAPEQVQAALARGQAGELWETVAAVQTELNALRLPDVIPSIPNSR